MKPSTRQKREEILHTALKDKPGLASSLIALEERSQQLLPSRFSLTAPQVYEIKEGFLSGNVFLGKIEPFYYIGIKFPGFHQYQALASKLEMKQMLVGQAMHRISHETIAYFLNQIDEME